MATAGRAAVTLAALCALLRLSAAFAALIGSTGPAVGGRHGCSASLAVRVSRRAYGVDEAAVRSTGTAVGRTVLALAKRDYTESEIKTALAEYLAKRKEANADEIAKREKGKVIGGTKGNKVLDYVSAVPSKERVVDRVPNVFDYGELTKYGYGYLVTPIMEMGGRRAVYELMQMEAPPIPASPKPSNPPKLVIDRKGESDPARYTGLKMGQILNDDAMAEALARANSKAKDNAASRPVLEEETYVMPFADKRNTGPKQTPVWTPEKLDEYGRQMGRAQSWARRAKQGEFVKDPYEVLDLDASFRLYFIAAMFLSAFAFGRATPAFLQDIVHVSTSAGDIQSSLQPPALALLLASIGSAIACGAVFAPQQNRNAGVWTMKGLVGGPLAVSQLRNLNPLVTYGEQEQQQRREAQ